MLLRKITGLAVCGMIIGSAALALAGVPDLDQSSASLAYTGTETLSLYSLPNGNGRAFASAFLPGGAGADATVTLTLLDGLGAPISGFPFQDMWLEPDDQGLVTCGGNATADANTNAAGVTTWTFPLFAGGHSDQVCWVMINGDPLNNGGLALHFNSSDLDGTGKVDVSDVGIFAGVYFGSYTYGADFNFDNAVNVSDLGFLANGYGSQCP